MKRRKLCFLITASFFLLTILSMKSMMNILAQEEEKYVAGELLVMYSQEVPEEQIDSLIDEQGGEEQEVILQTEDTEIALVSLSDEVSVEEVVEAYRDDDRVLAVSPNYELELFADKPVVNDSDYTNQNYLFQTAVQHAWAALDGVEHSKIKVAVLDTGADITHPDLKNVLNLSLCGEVLDSSGTMGELKGDGYNGGEISVGSTGHGTHVSGIIAAEANNGLGIAGVCSAQDNSVAELIVVDVFTRANKTTLSHLIKGMEYARSCGAKIINMSLGVQKNNIDDSLLQKLCEEFQNQGIVLICAAGNYGSSDYGHVEIIPADYDSTIGVIAVDGLNQRMVNSCYGSLKDVSAPGKNIYSTVDGGAYGMMSGSSMAAPQVTAVAAMMCSVDSSLSPKEIKSVLQSTATDIGEEGFDIQTGYGLLNARRAVETVIQDNKVDLPYNDVPETGWYYEGVSYMYKYGIMTGMQSTVFGPSEQVSRAQFATILYRYAGEPMVTSTLAFPDVSQDAFYADAVAWAYENGIIHGYDDGYFGPADPITREQIAVLLYRYAEKQGYVLPSEGNLNEYPDGFCVSTFAQDAMLWANKTGIIRGNDNGTLAPQDFSDRAACATIVTRFMEKY